MISRASIFIILARFSINNLNLNVIQVAPLCHFKFKARIKFSSTRNMLNSSAWVYVNKYLWMNFSQIMAPNIVSCSPFKFEKGEISIYLNFRNANSFEWSCVPYPAFSFYFPPKYFPSALIDLSTKCQRKNNRESFVMLIIIPLGGGSYSNRSWKKYAREIIECMAVRGAQLL